MSTTALSQVACLVLLGALFAIGCDRGTLPDDSSPGASTRMTRDMADRVIAAYCRATNVEPVLELDAAGRAGFDGVGHMQLFSFDETTGVLTVHARIVRMEPDAAPDPAMLKQLSDSSADRYRGTARRFEFIRLPQASWMVVSEPVTDADVDIERFTEGLAKEANWWLNTGIRQASDALHK